MLAFSISSMDSVWVAAVVLCYPLTWVLIPWVLLKPVVHPSARIAWILAILFLPYVGALLALVFGVNQTNRRVEWKRHAVDQLTIPPAPDAGDPDVPPHLLAVYRMAKSFTGEPLTAGNAVTLLDRTPEAFDRMEQAIKAATETINVSFYIWRSDRIGQRMGKLLADKAREGVEVRFLYDEIGSLWLTRKFLREMKAGGVKVGSFLAGSSLRAKWSFNLRSHRKIVVVDGHTAFTGGLNVGDEYLGRDPHFGFWRDTFIEVRGPAAERLQRIFTEDWFYATQESLTDKRFYCAEQADDGDYALQVLPDGPADREVILHDLLFVAISNARECVDVATGYFVPSDPLMTALTTAARRGVKVRILTAGKNTYTHTLLAGRARYEDLLKAGAEVYEYQRGLFHSKTTVVDGLWSVVGTPNFDLRSLMLNFEDAVMCYDPRLADQLTAQFDEDLQHSRQFHLKEWKQRSVWKRLGEEGCQIFAPVL